MSDFRKLTDRLWASPQIDTADVERAKAEGFTHIICNRPDDEAPGQPAASEIEAAAAKLGMGFTAIPVGAAGIGLPQVDAMQSALAKGGEKVLAYCRSGTRSTMLWALAQARSGADIDDTSAKAAVAGYDTGPVRATMEMFARGE